MREKATELESNGVFLGGPVDLFEVAGQKLLMTMLSEGVKPYSKVLDIGCGSLRGGYWLIHFLQEGCYFGIEPNVQMLESGKNIMLEPGVLDHKKPRFDHNADFDLTVFGESFDYLVARSIWSHASKEQIQKMLDGFVSAATSDGVFLTSYLKASMFNKDYAGAKWVGRSHESNTPGVVCHSLSWIKKECAKRSLLVAEVKDNAYNYGNQSWLKISLVPS